MGLMDLASNTGKPRGDGNSVPLKLGEVVEVILVKQIQIYDLKKKHEDRILEAKQIGEKPPVALYKDMGLAFSGYIYKRNIELDDDESGELVFENRDNKLIFPKWNNNITIKQYPPSVLYNMENCDIEYGLGGADNNDGKIPYIIDMQPRQRVATDFKTKVTANNIPKGQEMKFALLTNVENKRKEEWKQLKAMWLEETEETRKAYLLDRLARRYLMCHKEQKEYFYVTPQVGIKFKACVVWVKDFQFSVKAIGPWNKETRSWNLFSGFDTYKPSDIDIKQAEMIAVEAEEKRKREIAKSSKPKQYNKDNNEENNPGF